MGTISLTDLIRELGYQDVSGLRNWIRGIIKDKEDFNKRFSPQHNGIGRRPEKFLVYNNRETRVFVDNLCFLKPYMSFFSKCTEYSKQFSPYLILKNGHHLDDFCDKKDKLIKKLQRNKEVSIEAIKDFENFITILENNEFIDITRESIKNLNMLRGK